MACYLRPFLSFTLCLSATISSLLPVYSQQAPADMTPRQVDAFIKPLMDSAKVPGLSIAMIRGNKVSYTQGYGLTKANSTQRVNASTIFNAASLSKPVFAYAVLQMVEQGLIDLDKPLYEYLPYPDVAADKGYQKITARMVLSHRTGSRTGVKTDVHRNWR